MYLKNLLTIFLMSYAVFVQAVDLPGYHKLKQNESGDYYVVNKENITMVEPAIIKLGANADWILACIKNESIDTDLIRWVFIDIRNGGTFDTLNAENWAFYRDEAYPDLKQIALEDYQDEDCP